MNPFRSLREYELFVYSLPEQFPAIGNSTLLLIQRGRTYAELAGELIFANGYRLVVFERLIWEKGSIEIEGYSYEGWQNSNKLHWYDSQPHPNINELSSTQPHHKHIPPDIKHHRVPAPGMSFTAPNLPFLIREMEQLASGKEE